MKFRPSALVAALGVAMAMPATAQTFSNTIYFGDSLTDSGTFIPALIQIAGPGAATVGKFTTNPYQVWSEQLARRYGVQLAPSNQGGTNYAVGGARAGAAATGPFGAIPSVTSQVSTYLSANGGRADANALYSVWAGGNDMLAVLSGAPAQATIGAAVTSQVQAVGALAAAGAQYILVPTLPDLGLTPTARALGAGGMAAATGGSTAYNTALYGGLTSAGLSYIPVDTFNLLREIVANPSLYGITNTTATACGTVSSVQCSPSNYVAPGVAETYLFADGVHPTGKLHTIMADLAYSMIEGPRQLALASVAAVNAGVSRADRVFAAADLLPNNGRRLWLDVHGNYQNGDSSDLYKSNGVGVMAGLNWGNETLSYGPYVGFDKRGNNMGDAAGSFDQNDVTVGGLLRYSRGPIWVSAQASYSKTDTDFDRRVKLGPTTRIHAASADGSNVTGGLQMGTLFNGSGWKHGPFIGVVAQKVSIDAFTESDSTASTALSIAEQDADSVKGRVGWQAQFGQHGPLRPYASVAWNREFKESAAQLTATSLSTKATYAVPGYDFDRDYGTINLGARTHLLGHDADLGISANVSESKQQQATFYATISF